MTTTPDTGATDQSPSLWLSFWAILRSNPLFRYLLRRLGLAVLALVGVIGVAFFLTSVLPGNPAVVRAGPLANEERIERYEREMGLDRPLVVQFADYVVHLAQGDLGESWSSRQPAQDELRARIPATVELGIVAFGLTLAISLPLGILAAVYQGTIIDWVIRLFATFGASVALFWLALIGIHLFYYEWDIAPPPLDRLTIGTEEPPSVTGLFTIDSLLAGDIKTCRDALNHLWLPAMTLALVVSAPMTKMIRSAMLETLDKDFIRTARAVGLPPRTIILVDALRSAFIPVLTTSGIVFGYLVAGNVIVERVFSWAGVGQYVWQALDANNLNAVRGFILLIAVVYIVLNLVIDLLYSLLDPRIRLN
ncbi:MAG: ABC transporter permease [Chloroflexota bacterium]|nr:MAG: ABC transporter permease [Chloroflexota bacterium]